MINKDTKLKRIEWNNGNQYVQVGKMGCVSITVVMVDGQMAGVPWALATYDDGDKVLHNIALCESVIIA